MTSPLLPHATPRDIEAASFAIIDREAGPDHPFRGRAWEIARRLIHTTADFDLLETLHLPESAIDAGIDALQHGTTIFTDTEMARCGMTRRHLEPLGARAVCMLQQPGVIRLAQKQGGTRSRAAIELAGPGLAGSIVAIGNAPTALLALLELLEKGAPAPALVVAMPVGFVNAAEAKAQFVDYCSRHSSPECIAILGRKGGSTLAAATVNALAQLALASGNRK